MICPVYASTATYTGKVTFYKGTRNTRPCLSGRDVNKIIDGLPKSGFSVYAGPTAWRQPPVVHQQLAVNGAPAGRWTAVKRAAPGQMTAVKLPPATQLPPTQLSLQVQLPAEQSRM